MGLQLFRAYEFGVPEENTPVSGSKIQLPPYYPDTPTVRSDIARHYNNIAQMDGQIGRILAQLKTEGLLSNTIVIWAADNGDGLPRAKREVFDTGVKVPMIILWPEKFRPADAVPGTANSRMISFVDLAPTILSLAGATVPEYMQGRNFTDPAIPERRYIHAERDRLGCQYASHAYVAAVQQSGLAMSMTEKNHSAENALAERVNGILKQEYWLDTTFENWQQARQATAHGICMFNTRRPHTALKFATPEQVHHAAQN